MALIDYRGFRVVASSILPIEQRTLVYGSCDLGRTVHVDNPQMCKLMEEAGKKMNLKPHIAALPGSTQRHTLYAPIDIEGKKNKKEDNFKALLLTCVIYICCYSMHYQSKHCALYNNSHNPHILILYHAHFCYTLVTSIHTHHSMHIYISQYIACSIHKMKPEI